MPTRPTISLEQTTDQRSPRRTWLFGATGLVITILIGVAWANAAGVDEVETIRPTAVVTAVDVDLAAGSVDLATGEQLAITIERRSGRLAGTAAVTTAVADGVLRVTGTCPTLGVGHCATDVTITLPRTTAVEVATGAGSIDGLLTHGQVRASTRAGSIALTITEDAEAISVSTRAGSIDLIVPDVTYDVAAHTGVGRTRIDVDADVDSPRTIDARSDVGSVTVRTDPPR